MTEEHSTTRSGRCCYAGVFALVVVAAPARSARSWLAGLAIGLVAVSVLSLGSRMIPSLFPAPGRDPHLAATRGRLSYPLGYWNGLGALLALGAVLLRALSPGTRAPWRAGRWPRPPSRCRRSRVFLTSSRGGAVAGAVGFVVLLSSQPQPPAPAVTAVVIGGIGTRCSWWPPLSRDLFTDGRTGAPDTTPRRTSMLLLTLVVVAAAFTIRPMVDGLVERVRVPRAVSAVVAVGAAVALIVGLLGADPVERWHELKAPPDTQGVGRARDS